MRLPDGDDRSRLSTALMIPGLVALVAEPAIWLVHSWSDPSYQSDGGWVAALVAAMLLRSLWSGLALPDPRATRWAWRLLLATAAVRLAGRLLAVKTIGALALVLDVGALALLLGVGRRPWAVGPFALAALGCLALPVEHLTQRLLGHPLQLLAARSAELVLKPCFPALERQGTLLLHPDVSLAIDLPCSGARGIVLLAGIALALLCRRSVRAARLCAGLLAVFAGALLANVLRIVSLFLGTIAGFDVVAEPWHSAIGSASLVVGSLPLLFVAAGAEPRKPRRALALGWSRPSSLGWSTRRPSLPGWIPALVVSAVGLGIAFAPESPLDRTAAGLGQSLPENVGAFSGVVAPLLEQERRYYARYGGGVQKRVYRDGSGASHTALLVHTRAPLRHLHGPDRCLLGAGHEVTRIGVRPGRIPTVVYRSDGPDGSSWRVQASFVSDRGAAASGVSEAVWRWLEKPEVAWNLIERISPWELCEAEPLRCERLDAALFRALDLSTDSTTREGKKHVRSTL